MTLHYVADEGQNAQTLCGLRDGSVVVTTWLRRAVTCPRCAERFDASLHDLRRAWRIVRNRFGPPRATPPASLSWLDKL